MMRKGTKLSQKARKNMSKSRRENDKKENLEARKELFVNSFLVNALRNDSILNGIILSDAHIEPLNAHRKFNKYSNARLTLEQKKHQNFVRAVAKHLKFLGFNCTISSRLVKSWRTGKWYPQTGLKSGADVFFTELRRIWYKDGKKRVPRSLKLDAETLAWWHMGDGTNSPMKSKGEVNKRKIKLATNDIHLSDIELLIKKIKKLGIEKVYPVKDRDSTLIQLAGSHQVADFIRLVKPYVTRPFYYKLKMPLERTNAEYNKSIWEQKLKKEKDLVIRKLIRTLLKIDRKKNPVKYTSVYKKIWRLQNLEERRAYDRELKRKKY